MKSKRLPFRLFVIILLFGLVIGFGMPHNVRADTCYYEGYIVHMYQLGTLGAFAFREKPIDAGWLYGFIGTGAVDTIHELALQTMIRSALQNNTKVGFILETTPCASYDPSQPGQTFAGTLNDASMSGLF
jgi:hypothetical protein